VTDDYTQRCKRSHSISAEDNAGDAVPTDDPVAFVAGRDGRNYPVWKNPNDRGVANLIAKLQEVHGSLRAMLIEHDLYHWQSVHVLHGDFVRQTGVDGVRMRLAPNRVAVNEETVGVPSDFPWIFGSDGDPMDVERRREIVERWLHGNSRLAVVYPRGFTVNWYM